MVELFPTQEEVAYCTIEEVKERLLIPLDDSQYDNALNSARVEASRLVDMFLRPYTDEPPPYADYTIGNPSGWVSAVDKELRAITADFAASIFKRRMFPEEVGLRGPQVISGVDSLTQMDASGWFALALKKLEVYIRNHYVFYDRWGQYGEALITSVYNPDIYIDLYRRGLITGQEARTFLSQAVQVINKKVNDLTETITRTLNETVTREEIVSEYKTRKQKKFVFIKGKEGTDQYEVY